MGFGTLFAPQSAARREGKEWLGRLPTPPSRPKETRTEGFMSSWQSILFLLACIRNTRCTKACQSPQPRLVSSPRVVFLHSLRLSGTPPGGTGFPAHNPGGTSMRKPGACGLWHAFCTANNCQARRKRMPRLAANSDSSLRSAAGRPPSVLLAKHSFPSRLHQDPTVHKSVPKPTAPASFQTTRGFPSYSQTFQPGCSLLGGTGFPAWV